MGGMDSLRQGKTMVSSGLLGHTIDEPWGYPQGLATVWLAIVLIHQDNLTYYDDIFTDGSSIIG